MDARTMTSEHTRREAPARMRTFPLRQPQPQQPRATFHRSQPELYQMLPGITVVNERPIASARVGTDRTPCKPTYAELSTHGPHQQMQHSRQRYVCL
eukprot:227766-Alexandrium_andersonii.AAC.1